MNHVPWITSSWLHVFAIAAMACVPARWWLAPAWQTSVPEGSPILIRVAMSPEPPVEPPPMAVDIAPLSQPVELEPRPALLERPLSDSPRAVPPQALQPEEAPVSPAAPSLVERPRAEPPPDQPPPMPVRRQAATMVEVETPLEVAIQLGGQPDRLPTKLPTNPEPIYPADALAARIEGRVLLRATIEKSGRVGEVSIERSSGHASLDRAALDAVRRWRFTPAERRGAAIVHEVIVPVRFTIRDAPTEAR
jgi:protein TonB